MRAGYRKVFMFAQVATLIGIKVSYDTRFWEDAKNQCELYNLPQKALGNIWNNVYLCGIVSWGSVDAYTCYIHKWGMELAFLGYKKKIVWEDFPLYKDIKSFFL